MRLDKWLWAARFYKSRSLAHAACEGGKVDVNAQASKPSRTIRPGDRVELTLGEWRREVVIKALADRRGPAAEARALYEDLSRRRRLGRCARSGLSPVPPGSGGRPSASAGSTTGFAAPDWYRRGGPGRWCGPTRALVP